MDFEQSQGEMSQARKIRVLMVEDTRAVRTNLSTFLVNGDDLELVGDATSGKRAINLIERLKPDVILLGFVLEGMDGLTTLQKIQHKYPHTPVIVMTSKHDPDQVNAAMAAGAAGHVLEDFTADELACVIRNAYIGWRAGYSTLNIN